MKNFINKIITLDNIKQWEERDSIIKESVSQHSFKVSAICSYLLKDLEPSVKDIRWVEFKCKCLQYSILHDFDEAILGRDISHVVKYNSYNGGEIRKALDSFVDNELDKVGKDFKDYFDEIKSDPMVKLFVKYCDWIALYTFIVRNQNMGCKSFNEEKKYCRRNMGEYFFKICISLQTYWSDINLDKFKQNQLKYYEENDDETEY